MSATNFFTLRQRVQDEWYGSRANLLRGTNDSGSTTTIVDSAVALPGSTADHYDYSWAKIVADTAGAAPQGEVRAVTEGGWAASTGTFTTVAFTAATAAGDTYEIWPDYHPDAVDAMLNKTLRGLHMPSFYPLSLDLVTSDNNDFESATAGTGWTLAGGASIAKETTRIYNGTRADKITHTTASTDFYTRTFSVVAEKTYYTAAVASCDDGDTARLRVVNASASNATIEDASTTQTTMQELVFPWTAPSGCRSATVRLMAAANSDVTYWDDYQTWSLLPYIYQLPSWITRKEQLIRVVGFPPGTGGPANDFDYIVNERQARPLPFRFERADTRATNELFIYVETYSNWRPYIVAYRPLDEVTADYVTTTANTVPLSSTEADAVVFGVLAEMHRQKASASVGEVRAHHTREAQRYEREYDGGTRHLRPEWREQRVEHKRVYGVIA